MRTETDTFYQKDNECFQAYGMLMPDGDIGISAHDPFDVITVSLSKRKAAKLARQILELSGETEQKLVDENQQLRLDLEKALSVVNRAAEDNKRLCRMLKRAIKVVKDQSATFSEIKALSIEARQLLLLVGDEETMFGARDELY
ncbi:hypothetical protein AWJ09_04320 [Vibrio cholerae]|uniref:hypothetical protein n=1 Tax=Vibrio cholerae TaxID=666 RepID=UPI0007C42FF7|nr:hypothetical protein [Vibrio cholerae]KAA1217092.1 hypothetical protein F0Q05_06810 [Vibrio cholerae]KAA1219478.1 hypothetical protein F0P99_08805 [Vibrio cholerae]MTB75130.1 hypothetical protein [Vibrio cholerae O1 biovar El Tor]OAE83130.1 hypothetical protein AWJ09_04320 [Vibrio cholerae]TYW51267.1 hypothetical protein FY559_16300 [Vibrio cholerae]